MWPSKTGVTRGLEDDPEHELYDPEQLKVSPMDCVAQQDQCHPWYGGLPGT